MNKSRVNETCARHVQSGMIQGVMSMRLMSMIQRSAREKSFHE